MATVKFLLQSKSEIANIYVRFSIDRKTILKRKSGLTINPKYWKNGSIWDEKNLTKEQYQKYIDDMVKAAQARGKYIILDCHRYVMPQQDDLDMWKELEGMIGENQILVVRPDSGPVVRTAVETVIELGERFGYTLNDKGSKVLNKVRVIYGDGIDDLSVIEQILFRLDKHGYSADNIAFGMGGGLLQKCDRDTYKFAMKCSAIVRQLNGKLVEVDVYKDPITDPGKASKKGFLDLIKEDGEYKTVARTNESLLKTELKIVYKNGKIYNEIHIDKVRANAAL